MPEAARNTLFAYCSIFAFNELREMDVRVANDRLVAVLLAMTMLSLPHATEAYPTGPPVRACSDMTPQHPGTSQQSSAPPYTITAFATCYTPGQGVNVTLSANSGSQFKGFFLQARKPNDNTASYGTFDVTGNSEAKTLNCFAKNNNAVGHNSRVDKSTTSFVWTPASDLTGDVEFVATVVQSRAMYWVAEVKNTLQLCDSMGTETNATTVTAAGEDTTSPPNAAGMFVVNGLLLLLPILKLALRQA